MDKLTNNNIKLAIQKDGRLTEETLNFLRSAGLEFESYRQRLFSVCRNFPLEILYVRQSDIPDYVASGTVDLGILGQNIINEKLSNIKKILNLRYGFCSLAVASPNESNIKSISDLKNKRVATSYPNSAKIFFRKQDIPVEIVKINGSVELAPILGVADAIVDLVSTGETLRLNGLKQISTIYKSEAVLIASNNSLIVKKSLVETVIKRFESVLTAQIYKYA